MESLVVFKWHSKFIYLSLRDQKCGISCFLQCIQKRALVNCIRGTNMVKVQAQNLQADIVIIGGGGSGLTAAVAALGNSAEKIIILEKNGKLGGNAVNPSGIFAVNTDLQMRLGMDAYTDDAFRKAMDYAHWKVNGRLIRALVEKSGDTINWLEDKGMNFVTIVTHFPNQSPNTYHAARGPEVTGAQIVKLLSKELQESPSVCILCNTPAKKLFLDEQNKIAGVLAETKKWEEIKIDTKAVIVCTGGFSGNEKLIKKHDPFYNKDEVPSRGIPQQGDGIIMASEIGVALGGMFTYEWEPFSVSDILTVIARRKVTIWINKKGVRFIDESILSPIEVANAMNLQPGKIMYSLFDEKIKGRMLSEGLTPFEELLIGIKFNSESIASFPQNAERALQTYAKVGGVMKSNSRDKIASWIGVEPEVLKAEIEEYNSFCDHGHDDVFAKDRHFLLPLRQPPYYALKCHIELTATHGGIKVNHRMEALNRNDDPIPGLYAAGNEMGATDWDSYNMALSGHAFGYAINSGRIAGEEAAKYVKQK